MAAPVSFSRWLGLFMEERSMRLVFCGVPDLHENRGFAGVLLEHFESDYEGAIHIVNNSDDRADLVAGLVARLDGIPVHVMKHGVSRCDRRTFLFKYGF
jgi:hypothetical protein